jgi:hypothetical protein
LFPLVDQVPLDAAHNRPACAHAGPARRLRAVECEMRVRPLRGATSEQLPAALAAVVEATGRTAEAELTCDA